MEGKKVAEKIVSLTCLVFAGCVSAPIQEQPAKADYGQYIESSGDHSTKTEAVVTYSIVDSYILPGIKRSLVVRLNKKVSEETLRNIAFKLKVQDPRYYVRTFISYNLPGMKLNSGAWATTHFDPNLEVRILGVTLEQEEFFRRDAANSPQSVIGTWLYEMFGVAQRFNMSRTWTIYRQDNSFYIKTAYTDGSGGTTLIEEKPHSRGRFFQTEKQITDGEYFLLDGQGDLQWWDKEGWIATAKKLK